MQKPENDNVLTLQRVLMNACAFCEYGSTQMASCVLGYPAQYQTHETVLVFIEHALAFQDLMYKLNAAKVKNNFHDDSDLSDFVVQDSEPIEYYEDEQFDPPEFP